MLHSPFPEVDGDVIGERLGFPDVFGVHPTRRTFEPTAGSCATSWMKKASEYRQHAAECRALATSMELVEQREQLLQMAVHWEKLADDRSVLIQRHPELTQDRAVP